MYSISLDIKQFSLKLNPLIESTIELSERFIHSINEVESQLHISRSIVSDIRENVDKILDVETKIRNGIEYTVMSILKNISAIGKGFSSFWRNYQSK